jgi:uncharacterized protein (TIGR00251 family)
MIEIKKTATGLTFGAYVQPKASKCAVVGLHGHALKIKLTAPPQKGAANKQCIEFLAELLELPKSTLTIATGLASRHKQIRIELKTSATDKATLTARLIARIQGMGAAEPG